MYVYYSPGSDRKLVLSPVTSFYMSLRMRKPTICICEKKDEDRLRGNREADQRLCFRYTYSTTPLLLINLKPLVCFCVCTVRFVSDLVGAQIVGFLTHRLIYFNIRIYEERPVSIIFNSQEQNQIIN